MQSGQNLEYPGFYGDGKTAEFILKEILMLIGKMIIPDILRHK